MAKAKMTRGDYERTMFERFKLDKKEIEEMGQLDLAAIRRGDKGAIREMSPSRRCYAYGMAVFEAQRQMDSVRELIKSAGVEPPEALSPLSIRSEAPIAPRAFHNVVGIPQYAIRGLRLVVDDSIADHFDICDIRVGASSIFTSVTPIRARMFNMMNSVYCDLRMYAAQPSQSIIVIVENLDEKNAHRFDSVLYGLVML